MKIKMLDLFRRK